MNVIKKNVTLKKKVIINVKLLQSIHRIDSLTVNKTLLIVSFSNSSNLLFFRILFQDFLVQFQQ